MNHKRPEIALSFDDCIGTASTHRSMLQETVFELFSKNHFGIGFLLDCAPIGFLSFRSLGSSFAVVSISHLRCAHQGTPCHTVQILLGDDARRHASRYE
jgi:hypothetical protein